MRHLFFRVTLCAFSVEVLVGSGGRPRSDIELYIRVKKFCRKNGEDGKGQKSEPL